MSTPDMAPSPNGTRVMVDGMRDYFNGQIATNLAELYGLGGPEELRGHGVSDFEIAIDDPQSEASLMKVWFAAHASAHVEGGSFKKSFGMASFVRSEIGQSVIRGSHIRNGILELPKMFKIIPADRARNPYYRMLSRLQTADGDPVTSKVQGARHAAQILVGDVVLTNPNYDLEHPDASFQDQVTAILLG